jgi:non-specific serine/threonine protein kinase/serine/threonine-protein kinase
MTADPDRTLPAAGDVSTVGGNPSTNSEPPVFGNYRLLQKLGEGGMGEVWAAEQERPMRRKVALKVIKAGMDSRQVIARFESERQALALMNHPNIARVFEAGESSHGRPYFVMELVEGVPVTQYCDTNRLSTEERLALFVQICDAVQHAHHKGVIHRDIKPSNVLVRIQDATAVPKIIDFGIAKATAQPLTDLTMFTEIGVVVGTPAYMSPEQAERTGLDVDTRTDVYSLGMLLYELGSLQSQPLTEAAVRRTIGAAYTNLGSYAPAEAHLLAAVTISTRAAGDAHPDTADSLLLLGNLRRAQGQFAESESLIRRALAIQRAALGDKHLKVGEAAQALAVTLVDLGKAAEAEPFERQALAIYRQTFGDTNAYTGSSLNNLAAMLLAQRRLAEAEPLAREALAIQRTIQGGDNPEIAVELQNYGALLRDLGRHAEAEPLMREALALIRKHLGNDHEAVARVGNNLAGVLRDQGKLEEAEPIYREALAIDRKNRPAGDPRLAFALTGLGWVLTDRGRPAEAEPLLREAVAIREKALPSGDWRRPFSRMLLGGALAGQHRFGEAEPLAVDGYTAMAANKETPSQWTRQALQNVITLYERWDEAEPKAGKAARAAEWRARLK